MTSIPSRSLISGLWISLYEIMINGSLPQGWSFVSKTLIDFGSPENHWVSSWFLTTEMLRDHNIFALSRTHTHTVTFFNIPTGTVNNSLPSWMESPNPPKPRSTSRVNMCTRMFSSLKFPSSSCVSLWNNDGFSAVPFAPRVGESGCWGSSRTWPPWPL